MLAYMMAEKQLPNINDFSHDETLVDGHSPASVNDQPVTRNVIFFTAFISLSAYIASFDMSYAGTVLLMPAFNNAFGSCNDVPDPVSGKLMHLCRVTATQQSLISLTSLAIVVGSLLASPISQYLGRRINIQSGCLIVAVGAAGMLGTSGSFLNYMVCKFISGVGLGMLYTGTIVYGVECAPPSKRGLLLSLYTIGLALGSAVANGVCAGTAKIVGDWSWKTPIICQIPLSVLLGFGVMLFPDSPRWFFIKGNEVGARKALSFFYQTDIHSSILTAAINEIQAYIKFEKEVSSTTSWTEIFRGKNRRRTFLAAGIFTGVAITGLQFVGTYSGIFLGGLGVGSPYTIVAIVTLCFFAGSLFGGIIIEFLGRRTAMIIGYSVCGSSMLIIAAVGSGLSQTSTIVKNVLVAFFCIWTFTFSACLAPAGWIATTEMHSVRLRQHGQAFGLGCNQIFSFGAAFWTPYMINPDYGNMGTDVGYFYFGITIFFLIITVFFMPETARLKLEQIDDYFESGLPAWKTSLARNKKIAAGDVLQVEAAKAS